MSAICSVCQGWCTLAPPWKLLRLSTGLEFGGVYACVPGGGLIPVLAGAIQLDIPVLIGVPDALFGSWLTPAGGLAVLAVMTDAEYRDDTVRLRPGDMNVTYTDGVTEAMNPKKELYSEPRLQETLTRMAGRSVEDTIDAIIASVKSHAAGAPKSDDISALAVRRS